MQGVVIQDGENAGYVKNGMIRQIYTLMAGKFIIDAAMLNETTEYIIMGRGKNDRNRI